MNNFKVHQAVPAYKLSSTAQLKREDITNILSDCSIARDSYVVIGEAALVLHGILQSTTQINIQTTTDIVDLLITAGFSSSSDIKPFGKYERVTSYNQYINMVDTKEQPESVIIYGFHVMNIEDLQKMYESLKDMSVYDYDILQHINITLSNKDKEQLLVNAVHLIRDKYSDSSIAVNYKEYTDENLKSAGIELLVDIAKFIMHELIGLCGCGDPEMVAGEVVKYLRIVSARRSNYTDSIVKMFESEFGCGSVYDNSLLLFMAYILDDLELTEHGTSIGGAWLTEFGEISYLILSEYLKLVEEGEVES